jgi:hypothetical protein
VDKQRDVYFKTNYLPLKHFIFHGISAVAPAAACDYDIEQ